ncbi:MAG: glycosyltransferase family 4 protein [bacterium]|nr:glycosyltransferase family 4 protein [bacterium]
MTLGCDVAVVAPSYPGYEAELDSIYRLRSFAVPGTSAWRFVAGPVERRSVQNAFESFRPDLVHLHTPFLLAQECLREAGRRNIPSIMTKHLQYENLTENSLLSSRLGVSVGRRVLNCAEARCLERVRAVVSPSQFGLSELSEPPAGLRRVVISNGVDTRRYSPKQPAKGGYNVRLLFVGRLSPEKAVRELAKTVLRAQNATLTIVGEGPEEVALRDICSQSRGRITLAGRLQDDEVIRSLHEHDWICVPGIAELQSISALEGMAAGMPAIARADQAVSEFVTHGVNGFLFSSTSELGAVVKAAEDMTKTHYESLSVQALKTSSEHELNRTGALLISLYERLTHGTRHDGADTLA